MTYRFIALLAACCLAVPALAGWPEIPFPAGTRVETLGDQVRLNGVPMRMYRATLARDADAVAEYYRDQLGPRLAETTLLGDRLLSQGRGDHFITIRVHPLGRERTVALVSISDAGAARQAPAGDSGPRLPFGTTILSDMESVDAGRSSRHLVGQNRLGLEANLKAIGQALAARGYRPDRQGHGSAADAVHFYHGERREARLVLTRADGFTFIELTTLNDL